MFPINDQLFASLQINSRSIQDMHIFGDPSRIPIIIVERVVNAPRRSTSGNSYFSHQEQKDTHGIRSEIDSKTINKFSGTPYKNGRVLKIVIFVHGFQACSFCYLTPLLCCVVKYFSFFNLLQ